MPKVVAWLGIALALVCLSACANIWQFSDLQTSAGDDATTGASDGGVRDDVGDGTVSDARGSSDVSAEACSRCSGQCVDLAIDHGNCGTCNNACLTSQVCQSSKCVCTGNKSVCGSGTNAACFDLMTDHGNCGACGNSCLATQACQGGKCVCPGAASQCGTGANAACVYLSSDHGNCGGCGTTCATGAACQNSVCTCATGQRVCGAGANSACVDVMTDNNNCGGCGTACGTAAACVKGSCVACASVPSGAMCGTPLMCVNTQTDHGNCGGCGNPCLLTQTCQAGKCACPAGQALCGSGSTQACLDLTLDQKNCGKCGTACTGGMVCQSSACVCPSGYHNCSGTCVPDTSTSTSSCGTTCAICPPPTNGASTCLGTPPVCGQSCTNPASPTLCGSGDTAVCVDTTSDPSNCGICGKQCSTNHATAACVASACQVKLCAGGFKDCDGRASNGCETNILSDRLNCGGCGAACNMTGGTETCVAGTCSAPVCIPPAADCDRNPGNGCEVDTSTSNSNCGSCGHACATGQNCSGGVCSACPVGQMQCGAACVSCPARPTNGTLTCSAGACVATCSNPSNPTLCGGGTVCVNTQTDMTYCGSCSTPCTATNKCLQTYACTGGVCNGSNPVSCPPATDACHAAGTCNTGTGLCSTQTPQPDGTTCTGSDKCNQTYTCRSGGCVGSNPVVCTATDACHVPGTCTSSTGVCSAQTPQPNNTPCTGANRCQSYTCQTGTCTGVTSVTCTASDGCHVAGTCDPNTGTCSNPNATDGISCNGSSLCQTYTCNGGICTGVMTGMCNSPGVCQTGPGTCSGAAVCSYPNAGPGTACPPMDGCHTAACNGSGMCTQTPIGCNSPGVCQTGPGTCSGAAVCAYPSAGPGTACPPMDGCHTAACDGSGACMQTPIGCNSPGVCQTGPGTCSGAAVCSYPNAPLGTPCAGADGGASTCSAGICQ